MIKFNNNSVTDAAIKNNLMKSAISRTLSVTIGGTSIPAENIVADSLDLKNDVLSGNTLKFGGCIPSQLTLRFFNLKHVYSGSLSEATITVSLNVVYLDGGVEQTLTQQLFTGYVYSVRILQKRAYSELTAFDEMYRMAQTKCKGTISSILAYSPSTISTLYLFMRKVLELYDGIYNTSLEAQFIDRGGGFQYELMPLLQIGLSKTLFDKHAPDDLTILDLLKAHSELNARFAYMGADGTLQFAILYSASGNTVSKKGVDEAIQYHQSATCEDFNSAQVQYLSFPYDGDQALDYGVTNNKRLWYISDNIITKCISSQTVVNYLVTNFWQNGTQKNYIFYDRAQYKPFKLTTFGEFWLELGDRVTANLPTYNAQSGQYENTAIDSFILSREIKGISNLKVSLSAEGSEYLSKEEVTATT